MPKNLIANKLKISTNRTKTATIALVLVLTVAAAFMASLPVVSPAIVTEETYIFINCQPNPVGVGQTTAIGVWIYPIPLGANERYDGIKVVMTKPDGTTETFGPVTGGPLGNWVWQFVPATTGNYTVQASWPGKTWYNQAPPRPQNVTRLGSTSIKVTLVVQQDPVEALPDTPLPTEYWTFPINAQNRLWSSFGGGYPYGSSPKTAHVLWTMQNAFGGIEGGMFGSVSYASGTMYESKKSGSFIINGLYYQYGATSISGAGDRYITGQRLLYCYDLATGEVLWAKDISVSFTQIYEYNSANQVGLHAYLWSTVGSTWNMYDAYTGNFIMNFTNARSGTRITEEGYTTGETGKGNMLVYMLNNRQGWMALWNFTKMCDSSTTSNGVITYQSQAEKDQFGVYGGQWRPRVGALNDWRRGIQWNVSFTPETDFSFSSFSAVDTESQVGICAIPFTATYNNKITIYGYSLNPKSPGRLWGPVNLTATYTTGMTVGSGAVVLCNPSDMKYYAYDIYTGKSKWVSPPGKYPWGSLVDIGARIAYDNLYAASYDALHCYDMKTGAELWNFYYGDAGIETPYGQYVGRFASVQPAGDGKIYCSSGVWHPMATYQRGDRLFCVDAFTGKNIWNYSGFWTSPGPIANGYVIGLNEYDQKVYCFNKGPSKTTVSVGPKVQASGSSVLIEGSVTDQSPGAPGTPAIADKFMTQWMEYIHQQQPKPMDAFGVPVILMAYRVDDGSMIDLTTVYSDINGHYEYKWTPPTTGTYKILATFPGSDSYWQSSAETALGVDPAPAPAEPVEIPAYPDYTPIFAGIIVAIIAVAILVVYDIFRKRK